MTSLPSLPSLPIIVIIAHHCHQCLSVQINAEGRTMSFASLLDLKTRVSKYLFFCKIIYQCVHLLPIAICNSTKALYCGVCSYLREAVKKILENENSINGGGVCGGGGACWT